jgi:hypothetical protein
MSQKDHLTFEGLQEIINIKASSNLGLSDLLKYNFINTKPVDRPLIIKNKIPDPNWLSGFVSAEGNFFVHIKKSKTIKIGHSVSLRFSITQNERDIKLMELLKKYLESGQIYKKSNSVVELRITKFSIISKILIPLLEKNSLHGIKVLDFLD